MRCTDGRLLVGRFTLDSRYVGIYRFTSRWRGMDMYSNSISTNNADWRISSINFSALFKTISRTSRRPDLDHETRLRWNKFVQLCGTHTVFGEYAAKILVERRQRNGHRIRLDIICILAKSIRGLYEPGEWEGINFQNKSNPIIIGIQGGAYETAT